MLDVPILRCGAFAEDDGVCWRVWAPKARQVELVLVDDNRRQTRPMIAEPGGYFRHSEPAIREWQRYAYRLDGGPERPDPRSLWQPDGVHRPSAVFFPERFAWTDQKWQGIERVDLVFYELHVGTFTPEGTFDAVIPRLSALRDLGVTAIEIMPVAQFPGPRNWGYDGVHLFAPQNTYGGPHGLQRLVDACHAAGLAVFLDVVYNHFGPEGNYAGEFGPYYSERYRTSWGPAFNYDGPGSDPVRTFVLDNVRYWIEDFHFDGLRLDAVHSVYDARPRHILRECKELANAAASRMDRRVYIIAESLMNDVRMVRPPECCGYGLDAEWNEDFHHALQAYLTGERQHKYVDFGRPQDFPRLLENTWLLDGRYSQYRGRQWGASADGIPGDRFVIGVQNHDHVGNRSHGDRLAALVSPAAVRLSASLVLLAPHLPLLFMGEEYGEQNPFLFFCSFDDRRLIENVRQGRRRDYHFAPGVEPPDPQSEASFIASRLSWSWPEGSWQAGLRHLYEDLLKARRTWPALRDYEHRQAWLWPDETTASVLHLVRGGEAMNRVHVCFNLTAQAQAWPEIPTGWVLLLSSEDDRYHGSRQVNQLAPYESVLFGPQMQASGASSAASDAPAG